MNVPGFKLYRTPNLLMESNQAVKVITTCAAGSMSSRDSQEVPEMQRAVEDGPIEWEPVSQGILAERIRAGAADLGGSIAPWERNDPGKGKEKRVIDGREYIFQKPLSAD